MEHYREIKNCLTWHGDGKFEAELINGKITKLVFSQPGSYLDPSKTLNSTDYRYLEAVYNCLGDLFAFMRDENKRSGYHFSNEAPLRIHNREEVAENEYSTLSGETRLRPLINYSHTREITLSREPDNDEPLRDIG